MQLALRIPTRALAGSSRGKLPASTQRNERWYARARAADPSCRCVPVVRGAHPCVVSSPMRGSNHLVPLATLLVAAAAVLAAFLVLLALRCLE